MQCPDRIALDVGLPDIDGTEKLSRLGVPYAEPVIMLTARGEDSDRIAGLLAGADDYLPSPSILSNWPLVSGLSLSVPPWRLLPQGPCREYHDQFWQSRASHSRRSCPRFRRNGLPNRRPTRLSSTAHARYVSRATLTVCTAAGYDRSRSAEASANTG